MRNAGKARRLMCRERGSGARVQVQREGGREKLSRAWHTWHGVALAVTCKALALHEKRCYRAHDERDGRGHGCLTYIS